MRVVWVICLIAALATCAAGADGGRTVANAEDGVPVPPISDSHKGQFIAALAAVLEARREAVSYDELMGLSGAAFRVHFWMPEWCPKSEDLLGGYKHHAPVLEALGYEYKLHGTDGEAWREAARRSLDAGRPVIMENVDGSGRYAVVVGCIDGGKQWTARIWGNPTKECTVSTDHPWNCLVVGGRAKPMEPRKAFRRSLEIALELAYTRSYVRDDAPQASGFAAYEAWIAALLNENAFARADAEAVDYYAAANEGIFAALIGARSSAARYIRSHADDLGREGKPHLLRAAELYQKMADALTAARQNVPSVPKRQVNQPSESAKWTAAMRRSQVTALINVVQMERQAASEISQVLALR